MGKKKKDKGSTVVDVESAEDKLGTDLIAEIAEKEWKTAKMPTEEELAQEKHKSTKARNHPNSRRNLSQYRKNKPKKTKEKIVKGLKFKNTREDVDPFDYIKLPENYNKNKIKAFLPARKALSSAEEEVKLYILIGEFLKDFDIIDLSSSDIEDVISLSMNRIIESRLFEASAHDPNLSMDVAPTLEKYRKHSQKIKEGLASRRADRVDPKAKQNFSIVDMVMAYDDKKREEFEKRIKDLEDEKEDFLERKNSK
jgi:hypothetical protein